MRLSVSVCRITRLVCLAGLAAAVIPAIYTSVQESCGSAVMKWLLRSAVQDTSAVTLYQQWMSPKQTAGISLYHGSLICYYLWQKKCTEFIQHNVLLSCLSCFIHLGFFFVSVRWDKTEQEKNPRCKLLSPVCVAVWLCGVPRLSQVKAAFLGGRLQASP